MKKFLFFLLVLMHCGVSSAVPKQKKSVRIEVKSAGTLASIVKQMGVDFSDIRTLVIAGPLNGDDIVVLRAAAGVSAETYYSSEKYYFHPTSGRVNVFDLSEACIVSGGGPYYVGLSSDYYDKGVKYYTEDNVFYRGFFKYCEYQKMDDGEISVWKPLNATFVDYQKSQPGGYDYSIWNYNTEQKEIRFPASVDFSISDFTSSNHADNSVSESRNHIYLPKGATLSFDYSVSSERGADYLQVTLNGKKLVKVSGNGARNYKSTVTSDLDGELVISYTKDEFASDGDDCGSVKNININYLTTGDGDGYHACLDAGKYVFHDKTQIGISTKVMVNDFEYKRTFYNTKWQALYIPFSLSYDEWSNEFEIARINDVNMYDRDDDGIIDDTEVEIVKIKSGRLIPNHPYMIRAKSAGEKTIHLQNVKLEPTDNYYISCSSTDSKFTFVGTYSGVSGSDMMNNGWFALSDGSLKKATSEEATLSACRWYMEVYSYGSQVLPDEINNVRVRVVGDDSSSEMEALGVNNVNADETSEEFYTLDGRKTEKQSKGVCLVKSSNGIVKKVWKK